MVKRSALSSFMALSTPARAARQMQSRPLPYRPLRSKGADLPSWWHRIVLFAAAFAAGAMLCATGRSAAQPPPSVAGQLLVASPSIGDPRFAHTVIVVARHDHDGAFGIVINRLVGETSLARLIEM